MYENERSIIHWRIGRRNLCDGVHCYIGVCGMKVGDLVSVGMKGQERRVSSIVLEICLPENHRNGLHLIKVLERGQPKWYPAAYIEAINEGG